MPFRDVIGHRRIVELLSRSVARDALPPSLIFAGPAGVGKRLAEYEKYLLDYFRKQSTIEYR